MLKNITDNLKNYANPVKLLLPDKTEEKFKIYNYNNTNVEDLKDNDIARHLKTLASDINEYYEKNKT